MTKRTSPPYGFELLYRIDAETAQSVRRYAKPHLSPCVRTIGRKKPGDPVTDLYFAPPGAASSHLLDRSRPLQLRLRRCGQTQSIFAEMKRYDKDAIESLKRVAVKEQQIDSILNQKVARRQCLHVDNHGNWEVLYEFCSVARRELWRPTAFVIYRRALYQNSNGDLGISIDYGREIAPYSGSVIPLRRTSTRFGILMKLRFRDRFPNWFREMIQEFKLQRLN